MAVRGDTSFSTWEPMCGATFHHHAYNKRVPPDSSSDFVTLARLLRPQGRRGELLADLLTDTPDLLAAPAGVFLVPRDATAPAATAERVVLEEHWLPTGKNAGRVVVKLPGCNSITEAEALAGTRLMLPAQERPALGADTFYVSDLIGCRLFNGNVLAGEVVDIEFAMSSDGRTRLEDAPPLLCVVPACSRISGNDPEAALVPFVRSQLSSVNIAERRIDMDLPEGLFETAPLPSANSGSPEE